MIFNNINFSEIEHVVVEDFKRKFLPNITNTSITVPGRIGQVHTGTSIGTSAIEIGMRIVADTSEESLQVARKVAPLLLTEEPKPIILRDEPDKYTYAVLEGDTSYDTFLNTGFAILNFICHDPLLYSIDETVITDVHDTEITRTGTAPVGGILDITISNDTNSLAIRLADTPYQIYIDTELKVGDELSIDLSKEFVTLNGNFQRVHLNSDFFKLPVGKFKMTTSNGSMNLRFREGWY